MFDKLFIGVGSIIFIIYDLFFAKDKLLSDKKVEEKPSETEEKTETVDLTDSDN